MNRRTFLSALGLTSGALMLPSLGRRASAALGDVPKRVIFLMTQHGTWYPDWAFNPGGLPDDQNWTLDLSGTTPDEWSQALLPLYPMRDKVTIVDGVSLASGEADPAGILRHEIGQVHCLSGAMVELVSGVPVSSVPTIDQIIANQIARPDRLRSIEIGIGEPPFIVNYRDRLQLLPAENRAEAVWEQLFGLVGGGASSLIGEQSAIMDRVHERYTALAPRLSSEDRAKVELHRDLVADLDAKIEGMLDANCTAPATPGMELGYAESFTANVEMLRVAMSCDLVRVATIHLGDIPSDLIGYPGANLHDDYAHRVYLDPGAAQAMTDWTAYHSTQLAELMSAFDAVPEGEGTMLDNTLIVWVGELGDGAHGFDKWPCVLAGGEAWRNGRLLHYPRDLPFRTWSWDENYLPTTGRPHQELLNSIARAFEVPGTDGAGYWRAPLLSISDSEGNTIDCGGVLEGLFS
ncbi:MAG: DUF1552 domain-containing protein [Myxococcota bacterium]